MIAAHVLVLLRANADDAERRADDHARRADDHARAAEAERRSADAERARSLTLRDAAESLTADLDNGAAPSTWRGRLWTEPDDARLSLSEAAEALGMTPKAMYHAVDSDSVTEPPIPHRREHNGPKAPYVFVAGELRAWIAQREVIRQAGVLTTVAAERVRRSPQRRNANGRTPAR